MYIRRVVAEVDRKEIYILIQRTEETQIIYRSILFRSFAVFDDVAANYDLIIESSYATPEEITKEIIRCKELFESGDRTHRIELGIPGLYPTQHFSDLTEDRLTACMNEEKADSSLCVSATIPVAVRDGYSYILKEQDRIFGGAAAGKKFANVQFDTSADAQNAIISLTQADLKAFEDFSGFTYISDTQTPKDAFMMEFF